MIGGHSLRLAVGVLLFGVVLGQQQRGPTFAQQVGSNSQQQRPIQPQRPLSVRQPRPSAQNLLRNQQQAFSGQRQDVTTQRFTSEQQGPHIPIVEDIRDGPFHDGSYYFGYVSSDGSVREEGAVPTADGSVIVTGSYSYTAPNGELFEMQYISDANGYRAFPKGSRIDFTPPQRILNAPAPPLTPFVDEFSQEFTRPILNQRTQSFRPVNNNLSNQVNRPFNRGRADTRPVLGNNRIGNVQVGSAPILGANFPDSDVSFSNQINVIAEPLQENNGIAELIHDNNL